MNSEVDTIHLSQSCLDDHPREQPWIRQLSVVGYDSEAFFHEHKCHLRDMPALRQVVIHHQETGPGDNDWWRGWDSMMEMYFFRDNPDPGASGGGRAGDPPAQLSEGGAR